MRTPDLVRCFAPKHEKLAGDDVALNYCTVVGSIQSGKTTTVKTLIAKINKKYKKYKHLNLETKYINNVFRIHKDKKIKEEIKDAEVINLFVDDAVTGASSKKYTYETETNWFRIRHYFREEVGVKRATLNVFFATQRYMSLQNILRNSPILIFKPLIILDVGERELLGSLLGAGKWKILTEWAYKLFIEGKVAYLSKNLIKMLGKAPHTTPIRPIFNGTGFLSIDGSIGAKDVVARKATRREVMNALRRCGIKFEDSAFLKAMQPFIIHWKNGKTPRKIQIDDS